MFEREARNFNPITRITLYHSIHVFRILFKHLRSNTGTESVVTEASVEFKSLLEKRVEEMKTAVRESNDMAKATLASMGLPAALEAEDAGQTIPESTRARLSAIRMTSGGGIAGLMSKLGDAG